MGKTPRDRSLGCPLESLRDVCESTPSNPVRCAVTERAAQMAERFYEAGLMLPKSYVNLISEAD